MAVSILMLVLGIAGLGLYLMSFSTGYYIFGQMNSVLTFCLLLAVVVLGVAFLIINRKTEAEWKWAVLFLLLAVAGLTCGLIFGDRVEAIGTTVVTDYDAGHGGEEAVYMSIVAVALLLVQMIIGVITAFRAGGTKKVVEVPEAAAADQK